MKNDYKKASDMVHEMRKSLGALRSAMDNFRYAINSLETQVEEERYSDMEKQAHDFLDEMGIRPMNVLEQHQGSMLYNLSGILVRFHEWMQERQPATTQPTWKRFEDELPTEVNGRRVDLLLFRDGWAYPIPGAYVHDDTSGIAQCLYKFFSENINHRLWLGQLPTHWMEVPHLKGKENG